MERDCAPLRESWKLNASEQTGPQSSQSASARSAGTFDLVLRNAGCEYPLQTVRGFSISSLRQSFSRSSPSRPRRLLNEPTQYLTAFCSLPRNQASEAESLAWIHVVKARSLSCVLSHPFLQLLCVQTLCRSGNSIRFVWRLQQLLL